MSNVFWIAKDDSGSDSLAVQLADEEHWNDLVVIIAVVCALPAYIFSHGSFPFE